MENSEVYDTRVFIAITDRIDSKEEDNKEDTNRIEEYKRMCSGFFKKLKALPTKYGSHLVTQYIVPTEIRAGTADYSHETVFPRARILPENAPKTKWEAFAERKGIRKNKNKRGGRIYNEETREFTPAFGKGSKNDPYLYPILEVKAGEDPFVNKFNLLRKKKKENKELQKHNEYLNLKRTQKLTHFKTKKDYTKHK
ncbi:regulator of ribosome biosynthesis [Nematocida sp. AWRm80]|nr:regulator of ribosome biosynthesis [Nematocida sp. AWRm80]